jgi:hypothetical protein
VKRRAECTRPRSRFKTSRLLGCRPRGLRFNRLGLAGSLLVPFVAGCAGLSIHVDAYKGEVPVAASEMKAIAESLLVKQAFAETPRDRMFGALKERIRAELQATSGTTDTNWKGIVPLLDSEWAHVDQDARAVEQAALAVQASLALSDLSRPPSPDANEAYGALAARVHEYRTQLYQFRDRVVDGLETLEATGAIKDLDATTAALDVSGIAASAERTGRIVGTPIFDPRIARLDQSPRAWSPFSSTHFSALGGNAQFVVLREGLVSYHQKSLDFDPTPVIGAGSAVFRTGLKVAAAVATGATGLPVSAVVPKQDNSSAPAPAETYDEADLQFRKEALERRRAGKRALLRTLAKIRDGTDGSEMKRKLTGAVSFYRASTAALADGGK